MSDFTEKLSATVHDRAIRNRVRVEALRRLPKVSARCACTASLYIAAAGFNVTFNPNTAGLEKDLRAFCAKTRSITKLDDPSKVEAGDLIFTVDANKNGQPDHVWIAANKAEFYRGYWRALCADNQKNWELHWRNLSYVRGGKGAMRYALRVGNPPASIVNKKAAA